VTTENQRRTGYFRQRKKGVKTKFIYLDHAGSDKLLHWLLLSLGCWLMLAIRFCVYNSGLRVDTSWEMLTVVMTSHYENVCSCKRHTVVRRVFCFWLLYLLCSFLASRFTTMSLDMKAFIVCISVSVDGHHKYLIIFISSAVLIFLVNIITTMASINLLFSDPSLCHRLL